MPWHGKVCTIDNCAARNKRILYCLTKDYAPAYTLKYVWILSIFINYSTVTAYSPYCRSRACLMRFTCTLRIRSVRTMPTACQRVCISSHSYKNGHTRLGYIWGIILPDPSVPPPPVPPGHLETVWCCQSICRFCSRFALRSCVT